MAPHLAKIYTGLFTTEDEEDINFVALVPDLLIIMASLEDCKFEHLMEDLFIEGG